MTNLLRSFSIDSSNKMFYNAKEICSHNPELFKGIKTKIREIIERKKIPSAEYVFACFNMKLNCWNISNKDCSKAQLLINQSWVDTNMFNIRVALSPIGVPVSVPIVAPVSVPIVASVSLPIAAPAVNIKKNVNSEEEKKEETKEEKKEESKEEKKDIKKKIIFIESREEEAKEEIENAPPLLELEPHEKFHDTDGEILEIETRGRRHVDEIFFRVRDVMKRFDMPKLNDTLIRDDKDGYKVELHYKHFTRSAPGGVGKNNTKKPVKSLFLTYHGLMRVLIVSRNKNAEKFSRWAITKLFTMQMGSKEAKEVLGTEILNIKLENYRAVFGKCPQNFPCIYLVELGKVGELRETFGISETINDELIVYKYGFTCDLKRRLSEHERDYGKQKNVNLDLVLFHYIDLKYTSEAEADVRDIFDAYDISLNVSGRNELIVLTKKQFERTKKEYIRTGNAFAGATKELQEEITRLKTDIIEMRLKHQLEVQEYKHRAEHAEFVNNLKEQHYQEIRVLIDKMNR